MDVLPRITRQLIELVREMSPVQRAMSVAVTVAVLFAFGWVVFANQGSDFQPVSFGKVFATEDLASAEQTLTAAGLTGFRRDGQRLLAPGKDLGRYNAALAEFDAAPSDLGSQMLKQYESLGPFSTDRQRQQMERATLLQHLRRMIKKIPDIEDAHVVVATSDRRTSWNQKPHSTANVTVKPRNDQEMSASLVNSLRQTVASMVPDLKPDDVTIFDLTRGQAYTSESTRDPTEGRDRQRDRELTRQYEQQIQKALAHIPHVGVTVHLGFDTKNSGTHHLEAVGTQSPPKHFANLPPVGDDIGPHQTGFRGPNESPSNSQPDLGETPKTSALSKTVQVSVAIPREYVRELVTRRIAKGEKSPDRLDPERVEEEVLTKVEQIVRRLTPADSTSNAISVTCVDPIEIESNDTSMILASEKITAFVKNWGSVMAITFFVLLLPWMFRRTEKAADSPDKVNLVESPDSNITTTELVSHRASPPQLEAFSPDSAAVLREEVRALVESDPAATATILSQWGTEPGVNRESAVLPTEGARRSAICLLSLDQALAAAVLGKLSREQVEQITLAIANAEGVTRDEQESILDDFKLAFNSRPLMQPAGPETARELLERTLDRSEVEPIQQQIDDQIRAGPFAFLHHRHADDIRRLIEVEHPQTVAVVAAQLPPNLAAQVLAGLDADDQADVVSRLARLGPTDVDLIDEIASLMQQRLGRTPIRTGGVSRAADVLRETARSTSQSVLRSIDRNDTTVAEKLRESLFSFQDLAVLEEATLRMVLEETGDFQWAVALKGSPDALQQRIFGAMHSEMTKALKMEMNSVGPLRLSEISAVQRQIAEAVLAMENDGRIEFPRQASRSRKAAAV